MLDPGLWILLYHFWVLSNNRPSHTGPYARSVFALAKACDQPHHEKWFLDLLPRITEDDRA